MRTFTLPDLGEGLTDAEVVAWHVAEGDRVVADQPLVSVETAKAVVEVPAPWPGRILALRAQIGERVAVGAPLVDIDGEDAGRDAGTVVGALPQAAPAPAQAPAATPVSAPVPAAAIRRGRASPAVRARAAELGVDLERVAGTGPGGIATLDDVEKAARRASPAEGFEPMRGVRRAMAEAMARSGAEVVAATVTDEAIIEPWPADADPTLRLVRAIAAGCSASPALNASLDGAGLARRLNPHVDLAIAMETEDGLFAPVLRNVAGRSAEDLRAGLEAMKRDVAARTIPLAELRGATITLSNFGMLGGLTAALAIVPPQVAILGAGRIHRAVRAVDGDVRIVRVLPLSLTFDHRAVTGAEAIRFLNAVVADLAQI